MSFLRAINKSVLSTASKQSSVCAAFQLEQRRWLNLHEYQSKDLLRDFGLNVQKGAVASSPQEAYSVSEKLKNEGAVDLILKCQVLTGGRGKGHLTSGLQGGVKICENPTQVSDFTKNMIGYNLITHQTTAEGEYVKKVLIHEGVNIKKELYLAILLDRRLSCPVFVVSQKGGMDIEAVAAETPQDITKVPVDVRTGLTEDVLKKVCVGLGFENVNENVCVQIKRLYEMFQKCDALQIEINPLAVTDKAPDHLVCVDAKINFDDNASYRQKKLFEMEDPDTKDPREIKAERVGLNFVGMDGNIGCLVNGAGLAMATMDIIKLYGGEPANFLDVGGGADVAQVTEAFRILQSDKNVKAMFVNIFGGIMRCDIIANGLVEAAKQVSLNVPLVVRLVGNNVEKGKEILKQSGVNCEVVDDFDAAAKKACMHVA